MYIKFYSELNGLDLDFEDWLIHDILTFDFSELYPEDKEETGDPIAIEVSVRG